jgi:hypothetical protein
LACFLHHKAIPLSNLEEFMISRPPLTIVVLAVAALAALPVSAQKGKPKPPPDTLGTAWIDNDANTPCAADSATRIHSDCQGDNGAYTQADGAGTYPKLLGDTGAFWLQTYGQRYVTVDFTDLVPGSVLCGTKCYRNFGDLLDTTTPRAGGLDYTVSLHGNAIDASGVARPNGLRGLAVGETSAARFFVNIPDPDGRSFHYTLYFDEATYSGTYAGVTRTAQCTWQIESNGYAELVAGGTGKNRNTREGVFLMPFRIVFDAGTTCD